ncbi:MAG: hypothetical protein JXA25_15295 [Anaerolineales bacterium]|nr:hypothetical protein [Anaerolineales bacterium]
MNPKPPVFPQADRNNPAAIYRPVSTSRRNELLSWISAAALAVSGYYTIYRTGRLPWLHSLFLGIFLTASAAISLANWLDRETSITSSEQGIEYSSPLRHCTMAWQSVEIVRILTFNRGFRIFVQSGKDHFTYRTISPGVSKSEPDQPGIILDGDLLTAQILEQGCFSFPIWQDGYWEYRAAKPEQANSSASGET